MGFIRIKKIGGKEYAYLVENKWYKRKTKGKGKGCRQKVSKYLGKVHKFNKENNVNFADYKKIGDLEQYLKNNDKHKIIKDLVEWEVFRHSVNKEEFIIDYSNKKIIKDNKEVSLRINEGFLNSYNLDRLFNLRAGNSYNLAKCFIESGIEIPKDIFVGIFGR